MYLVGEEVVRVLATRREAFKTGDLLGLPFQKGSEISVRFGILDKINTKQPFWMKMGLVGKDSWVWARVFVPKR